MSHLPLLALWGNKNGLPSMKVKTLENFQNKIGLKGCKWSSLNAPGTQTPLSHPYLKVEEFPFLKGQGRASEWRAANDERRMAARRTGDENP